MINTYPYVTSEHETLRMMLAGSSIARFGDGEWRCAVGDGCTSQRPDKQLAAELRECLVWNAPLYLCGIPNPFDGCPKEESWIKYTRPPYLGLLSRTHAYYSSFITRPDNAPWIDTPDYWQMVRQLWIGQDVILVVGQHKTGAGAEKKSISTEMIGAEARSVVEIIGPRQHAYCEINPIEGEILSATKNKPNARVLMCLGATATVLALRLSKAGIHALDVGHIGMFLRHEGAYRYQVDDLSSAAYRQQLAKIHQKRLYGADGGKHIEAVRELIGGYKPETILDYGCGKEKLAEGLKADGVRVSGYDPGIAGKDKMPKPCALVVCTDVLEHIEPDKLDAVLDHLYRLTAVVAYLVISTREAVAILPDGRNAHLIVQPAQWWIAKLKGLGWKLGAVEVKKDLTVIAIK